MNPISGGCMQKYNKVINDSCSAFTSVLRFKCGDWKCICGMRSTKKMSAYVGRTSERRAKMGVPDIVSINVLVWVPRQARGIIGEFCLTQSRGMYFSWSCGVMAARNSLARSSLKPPHSNAMLSKVRSAFGNNSASFLNTVTRVGN